MQESSTYQKVFAEGKAKGYSQEMRSGFLRIAPQLLGPPDERALAAVEVASVEQIEQWAERIWDVPTWQELLEDQPPQ